MVDVVVPGSVVGAGVTSGSYPVVSSPPPPVIISGVVVVVVVVVVVTSSIIEGCSSNVILP